jgi:hypothetical protein
MRRCFEGGTMVIKSDHETETEREVESAAKITKTRPGLLYSTGDGVSQSYPLPDPPGAVNSAPRCQHSAGDLGAGGW